MYRRPGNILVLKTRAWRERSAPVPSFRGAGGEPGTQIRRQCGTWIGQRLWIPGSASRPRDDEADGPTPMRVLIVEQSTSSAARGSRPLGQSARPGAASSVCAKLSSSAVIANAVKQPGQTPYSQIARCPGSLRDARNDGVRRATLRISHPYPHPERPKIFRCPTFSTSIKSRTERSRERQKTERLTNSDVPRSGLEGALQGSRGRPEASFEGFASRRHPSMRARLGAPAAPQRAPYRRPRGAGVGSASAGTVLGEPRS
ncbi:hypothetical protein JHFBIEKO_1605 [Methylobacterium mesophilicum]|nr:hypothetical protein JHFBIEKO_1605 [Methylobacterium mesophilicum]